MVGIGADISADMGADVGAEMGAEFGADIAWPPHSSYRPWTLDFDPIEARSLRDAVPSIDGGVVWRRGSASRPEVVEFI